MVSRCGCTVVTWGVFSPMVRPHPRSTESGGEVDEAECSVHCFLAGRESCEVGSFLVLGLVRSNQMPAPTERTGLQLEGGPGAEQDPLQGSLPAGRPYSCVPPSPGGPRHHPDLPFHVTYPSNVPGHGGTPNTSEGADIFARSAACGPGSGLSGPRHSRVDVAGKLRGDLGDSLRLFPNREMC